MATMAETIKLAHECMSLCGESHDVFYEHFSKWRCSDYMAQLMSDDKLLIIISNVLRRGGHVPWKSEVQNGDNADTA